MDKEIFMEETIFSKIIKQELPADIIYQDDLVTAFRDINPKALINNKRAFL